MPDDGAVTTTAGSETFSPRLGIGKRGAPPPVPSVAIRRARLEEALDERPDRQVVLVRGPAGAGKTVLVAQWTAAHPAPCAWLSVDSCHNDANLLLWHLIETVEQLSLDANEIVVGRAVVGADIDDTILWDVLNSVTRRLGTKINLVLDAVERLHDPIACHVLSRLVENPPEDVRLVLVSRSKPQLGLERARLRGDLVEVGPAALRFARAEIDALVATWEGRSPDPAELEQATLGWAAGLRLAQLQASADDGASLALREPDGFATEYVREELIDGSPEELRSFLEVTCWLPLLTGPVCAAIAGQRTGGSALTLSEMEALPMSPLPSRPGAFRYPPILGRVLQQEYRRRDSGAALQALRHAAAACQRSGEFITALELFLQAGCATEAADACAALAAIGDASLRRVDELFRSRSELVPIDPRLLPWQVRAAVAAGRLAEASQLLRCAELVAAGGDALGDREIRALVAARAAVAAHLGDVPTLLATADLLLSQPAADDGGADPDPQPQCWRIRGLAWSGDIDGARAGLRTLDPLIVGSSPEVALSRAWAAWFEGDITGAAQSATAARQGDDSARIAEAALLIGATHRERNQLAKAVPALQEASMLATTYAHNIVGALAASELARCHRVGGASMDALELVVSTRAACPDLPYAVDLHLRGTEVRVRLDQDDVAGAHAVVRAAPAGVDTQLLAARVALEQAPSRAADMLGSIRPQTPRHAVEKLLLRAELPGLESAEGSLALIKAVTTGERLGLIRIFLDEGPALCRRLSDLAFEQPDRALGRLGALVRQELALAPARDATPPVEQLTARELAVLRMLPLRMSNSEMAAQMYISVNTLKTHVRAIYRKLDVPHRSAAVRRAKALQLV